MTSLEKRLQAGTPVLLDGAMNTEIAHRGLHFNTEAWLRVNLDRPDLIGAIHGAYARAGAEIHIANSFATGLHVLEHFGFADEFEAINRAAVTVCREAVEAAADHPQWVAGSISTFAHDHDRGNLPDLPELERNVARQAAILADAGAALIALEMLFDIDHSLAMMRGAATVGLPVSVGFVCEEDARGVSRIKSFRTAGHSEPGDAVSDALARIVDACGGGVTLIPTVMHSEFDDTGPALRALGELWDGALCAYPNNGRYRPPGVWDTSAGFEPERFAEMAHGWVADGAAIVGGCCGVGPAHIAALAKRLDDR